MPIPTFGDYTKYGNLHLYFRKVYLLVRFKLENCIAYIKQMCMKIFNIDINFNTLILYYYILQTIQLIIGYFNVVNDKNKIILNSMQFLLKLKNLAWL